MSRPLHRRLLALAHCTLGEVDDVVAIFEEWLKEEPDHPIARHMIAACSDRDARRPMGVDLSVRMMAHA